MFFSTDCAVQDSLVANLLRLIKKMKPKAKPKKKKKKKKLIEASWDEREAEEEAKKSNRDINKQLFPALAMPNNPAVRVSAQPLLCLWPAWAGCFLVCLVGLVFFLGGGGDVVGMLSELVDWFSGLVT